MIRECWLLILCIFFIQGTDMTLPSVLWRCWLASRKGIWPVKNWVVGAGVVICLEWGADLHMAQLMPLPLTVSCFSKIQIGFTFLVLAHPDSPGQRAVKRMYVCKELTWCFILKPHLVSCSCDPGVFWVNCIWQNGARRTNCYWLRQTTLQVESGRQLISDFACVVFAELYLFYDMVILSLSTHAARLFVPFWRSCLLWLTRSLFWFAKWFCCSRF